MFWIFESLIIGFLVVGLILFLVLIHELRDLRKAKRNPIHRGILIVSLVLLAIAWITIAYGSFIEPRMVVTHYQTIDISTKTASKTPGMQNHLRFAVISDLHAGESLSNGTVTRTIETIRSLSPLPDAVLIDGDFIAGSNTALTQLEEFGSIAPGIRTFAVLGNHDYIDDALALTTMLEKFGIHVLRNESETVGSGTAKVAIVGLDDIWFGHPNFGEALGNVPKDMPKILLVHNPDAVLSLGIQTFDAIIAGHTHGGQIRLPIIGSVPPIPDVLGRAFDRGKFDWHGTPLLITSGIGTTGPPARLFVPPEVMVVDVTY